MRTSFAVVAAALVAACSPFGIAQDKGNDAAAVLDREAGELALVSVVRAPDGSCPVRLDGQPIAVDALEERLFRVVDGHVQAQGGIQNISDDMRVVFEAPEDATYECVMRPLGIVANATFSQVALRFAGRGPGQDSLFRPWIEIRGQPMRPYAELDLRADGSVLWGGQPITPEQLRDQLTNTVVLPADGGVTDGTIVITPERSVTFARLHELAGLTMEGAYQLRLQPPAGKARAAAG